MMPMWGGFGWIFPLSGEAHARWQGHDLWDSGDLSPTEIDYEALREVRRRLMRIALRGVDQGDRR